MAEKYRYFDRPVDVIENGHIDDHTSSTEFDDNDVFGHEENHQVGRMKDSCAIQSERTNGDENRFNTRPFHGSSSPSL